MPRLNNYRKSVPTDRDEFYTPACLVEPIIPYLKHGSTIWCPFDTDTSEFVLVLKDRGFKVSHLWEGKDFFTYTPDSFDYIVSNPPFTKKLEVLTRLYQLNKPFAIILGLPILNYQEVGEFFLDKPLQLLIVDKKVSYDGNTSSFNTSYFCNGILPNDIICTHLEHNNTGKNLCQVE